MLPLQLDDSLDALTLADEVPETLLSADGSESEVEAAEEEMSCDR